jgi:phage/plasmid-associated DNA primase
VSRRYFIINFNRIVPDSEVIREYDKVILDKEAPQIFSWMIRGLKRLIKRGYFVPPSTITETMAKYIIDNDPVRGWIIDNGVEKPGTKCSRKELYDDYRSYCDFGRDLLSKAKFFEHLRVLGYQEVKIDGNWFFKGLQTDNSTLSDR